ncbi:MAG: PAS domain S-box protein, partial [Deltaproteobacteria bacterium]|nr:PAS domain S-box protein [Deltaproteobacteria bacterium]
MSIEILFALLQNAALLMAMVTAYDLVVARLGPSSGALRPLAAGSLVGLIGIGVMRVPFLFDATRIFDTRSVLLCLAGLFLDPLATALAALIMAAYRLSLGGAWLTGVVVIATSALIGVAWRRRRPDLGRLTFAQIYGFGVLVHTVMLVDMFIGGWAAGVHLLGRIAVPVMVVYPLATAAIGVVLSDRERQNRTRRSLLRATRAAKALSEAARAITNATEETGLLREICRVFVEVSEYRAAVVGLAVHDAARTVRPVAQCGFPEGFVEALELSWDAEAPSGRGPTGIAIRERRAVVVQDTMHDPGYDLWRTNARVHGYQSSIALPLCFEDGTVGVLNLYARSAEAFVEPEQALLTDFAASVAFGVSSLRQRAARGEAEALLREMSAHAHVGAWALDDDSKLRWSEETHRLFGVSPETFDPTVQGFLGLLLPEERDRVQPWVEALARGEAQPDLEVGVVRGDGARRRMLVRGSAVDEAVTSSSRLRFVGMIEDVTERRRIEAHLTLAARRAQVLLSLPALAEQGDERSFMQAVLDRAEELTGSQTAFAHLVGGDARALELTVWSRGTPEPSGPPEEGPWAEALRRREPVVVDGDGPAPPRRGVSVPVIDGGLVRMIVGVGAKAGPYEDLDVETVKLLADATWRVVRQRRSDRDLRGAIDRLDLALEAGQHGLYDIDLETGRATVSPRYATMLGYDPATFTETYEGWMSRLHPDDRPVTEAAAQAYLAGSAASYRVESRALDAHGEWRWIQSVGTLVERDADGRPRRAIGTHTDITERKRAEEHLRQLAQAVEQSPESIAITDLAGDLEYVNAAFERVSGYGRDEVIGRNPRLLQSGQTPRETYAEMWSMLLRGERWQGTLINRRKGGETYVESVTVTPLRRPGGGAVTHYVAVKQDITEKLAVEAELDRHRDHLEDLVRLRTEELAQARDSAESASRAKTAFLANMSHEIRTPLNAIIGLAHLLRREAPTPELRRRLEQIDAASQHLLSIISDILDLSKIEAGRLDLDPVDLSLRALLAHVVALVGDAASAKGLHIAVDPETPDLVLRGDETRLRQALLNYASNAVKFTRRGSITCGAQVVARSADAITVRFTVRDTGPGIPEAKLARLFAVFEQGDSSTTREHGGTGLGLAITRSIARAMGGDAGADSTVGEGSTFWFTACLAPGEVSSPAAVAVDLAELERDLAQRAVCRVLLVEDNAINSEVASALLRSVGLVVECATDGAEAVEAARRGPFDLVLMDLHMPNMDGLAATRAIRALPGWARRPILAMTATTLLDDRRACLEAGMDDFVPKPFEPRLLFSTLLRWLPAEGHSGRLQRPASRPPGAGEALPEWTLAVDGLDARAGLRRMGGAPDRYVALLARFARDHGGDGDA